MVGGDRSGGWATQLFLASRGTSAPETATAAAGRDDNTVVWVIGRNDRDQWQMAQCSGPDSTDEAAAK
jgi:hypothetical protein